ncbi:MAG TPA: hypothetical protein PKE45_08450, partial [Caldilineaceae bacterium]|nr:hypothetical protein [Caldilineaceae bacterium]
MGKQHSFVLSIVAVAAISLLLVFVALTFVQPGRASAAMGDMSERRQAEHGMGSMMGMTSTMPAGQAEMRQMLGQMLQMMQQMQILMATGAGPMENSLSVTGTMPMAGMMSNGQADMGSRMQMMGQHMQMMGMMMEMMGQMQTMMGSIPHPAGARAVAQNTAVAPSTTTLQGSVWVADEYGNSITVIDAATNRVAATLTGIEGPHNLQVAPDGKNIWAVSGHG